MNRSPKLAAAICHLLELRDCRRGVKDKWIVKGINRRIRLCGNRDFLESVTRRLTLRRVGLLQMRWLTNFRLRIMLGVHNCRKTFAPKISQVECDRDAKEHACQHTENHHWAEEGAGVGG